LNGRKQADNMLVPAAQILLLCIACGYSRSIAFMVLGTLVLPIWEPNLGQVVVIFTLLIPSER
jgi:hypothetical protein